MGRGRWRGWRPGRRERPCLQVWGPPPDLQARSCALDYETRVWHVRECRERFVALLHCSQVREPLLVRADAPRQPDPVAVQSPAYTKARRHEVAKDGRDAGRRVQHQQRVEIIRGSCGHELSHDGEAQVSCGASVEHANHGQSVQWWIWWRVGGGGGAVPGQKRLRAVFGKGSPVERATHGGLRTQTHDVRKPGLRRALPSAHEAAHDGTHKPSCGLAARVAHNCDGTRVDGVHMQRL